MQAGDKKVEDDARRVGQYSESESADSAEELAGRLLTTVYMGTVNSGKETQERAKLLAQQVHCMQSPLMSNIFVACVLNWRNNFPIPSEQQALVGRVLRKACVDMAGWSRPSGCEN